MAEAEPSAAGALAEKLIDRVIEFGINGGGPLKGAVPVADEHRLAAGGDREEAVRRLVATHVRLAAVSGFATGMGASQRCRCRCPRPPPGCTSSRPDERRDRPPA